MPDTTGAVDRWGPAVYRLACAVTSSRSDADDVFQEVFLRYHRAAPDFESETHEKAWLLRVTLNRCKSLLASPWRRRSVPLEDVYACRDRSIAVAEALTALPPGDRTLLHLYYYEGYRTDELAGLLSRNPATVRSQLTRARQKLARLLKEEP
jgi:RNA polymerase sigma-70 factor (ECF subfamily)